MAKQQRELSGILFKNDKGDNPQRPDYRGAVTAHGVGYRLSGWLKQGENGPFLSYRSLRTRFLIRSPTSLGSDAGTPPHRTDGIAQRRTGRR